MTYDVEIAKMLCLAIPQYYSTLIETNMFF